jgi:hypothetical protein
MLYDKLCDIVMRSDWRLISVEYAAWAVGASVVATALISNGIRLRKRMRRIESQLQKMQKEIGLLQMQESRRLMTELNAKTTEKMAPPDAAL